MRQRSAGGWEHGVRLLVESPDPAYEVSEFQRFHDAGFAVAWCSGPDETDDCPLADGMRCALADWADVVLCGLPLDGERHRRVIRGLRRSHPDIPVVVPSPETRDRKWFELTRGCARLPHAASVNGQLRLLHRVFDEQPASA